MKEIYDLVIIGSGPAGLAAAIYAQRARLHTLVIEKEMMSGGQVLTTYEVDNYPGLPGINGFDLGMKLREHADRLEAAFVTDEVRQIKLVLAGKLRDSGEEELRFSRPADEEQAEESLQAAELQQMQKDTADTMEEDMVSDVVSGIYENDRMDDAPDAKTEGVFWKQIICAGNTYLAKSVIIASGATHSKLGVPGEERLTGMGISYCATCDGAFFRGKVTAVVGGGDVALEDAIFLSRMCGHVYLIHRRDTLRGAKSLQEKLFTLENVTIIWDTVVEEIQGDEQVEALKLLHKKTGEISVLPVDGVFIAVGITPNSQPYEGLVAMEHGYIQANESGVTSVEGIYAAGDVRTKALRQIVTAVSDGANAVTSVERYLTEH